MPCTVTRSAPSNGASEIHVPQTIEGAFAQGANEMIVVLPDSKTLHNGSMYSSSVTTGDFEQFIAHDLVSYIDAHYRTIPNRLEPRPGRPFHGRVRRDADRHEACRCVRQSVHHEPLLLVPAATGPAEPGTGKDPRGREDTRRLGEVAVLCARHARQRRSMVAKSEESAALS